MVREEPEEQKKGRNPYAIARGLITSASYQTIVVPLYGIVESERVLKQAALLAQACHASVLLVADPPPPLLEQQVWEQGEALDAGFLVELAERLHLETSLIVTSWLQAERKVMRFLHRSNVPVLFVCGVVMECNLSDNQMQNASLTSVTLTRALLGGAKLVNALASQLLPTLEVWLAVRQSGPSRH
jgi:hypothetical protein